MKNEKGILGRHIMSFINVLMIFCLSNDIHFRKVPKLLRWVAVLMEEIIEEHDFK